LKYFENSGSFSALDRVFSLEKNGETFEFKLSPVLNGTLFQNYDGKSTPISFEKMLEDYIEPSKFETVLKMYTILKIANANPFYQLKDYFDHIIAQQQEMIIRNKISITSLKINIVNQEEVLKVAFFDGTKNFIVSFKPFLKTHIYYNSALASLVVFPGFLEPIRTDRKLSEEEWRIAKIDSFVTCVRMKIFECIVHHYFTNSKEYKMRCLYDDDFAYWWKLRLK
jgi:hypothetical protein